MFSTLSFLCLSPSRLWKCSSWNFRSDTLAAASEAVIPSCQRVLPPGSRWCGSPGRCCCSSLSSCARMLRVSHSPLLWGGCDRNEWFCLQLAPGSGPLNTSPLEVNPETLWDPPWPPASFWKRLLMWLPYHFFLSLLVPPSFLVPLTAPTVLSLFLFILLPVGWQRYFETNNITQTGVNQLVLPISKYCSDPLEISLVLWIFLCLEKHTMSHWAQLNFQAPCSCHSSCSHVLFPTAVVECSIQTNQAELTNLWLDEACGSVRSLLSRDTKVWIIGLNLLNWDCGQLACQLMRRSYLLHN